MTTRQIKFRSFIGGVMSYWGFIDGVFISPPANLGNSENPFNVPQMQFTGLLDKNGLQEVYEGDIIDIIGNIKGNIYESPQIYEKGTDLLIKGMGTKEWRDTEYVAVGRGCNYSK